MAGDCQNQLLDKNVTFAIQLDETTTVSGESVLIVLETRLSYVFQSFLILFTEVPWLSQGQMLVRFMELQGKIKEFLQHHNWLLCDSWLIPDSYLADTFTLSNETTERMQGPNSMTQSKNMQARSYWLLFLPCQINTYSLAASEQVFT